MRPLYQDIYREIPRSDRSTGGILPQTRCFLLLVMLFCFVLSNAALAEDTNVVVSKVRERNSIKLIAMLNNCSEATITITATMKNMISSVPLPLTVDVVGQKR